MEQFATRCDYLVYIGRLLVSYGFVPIPILDKTPRIPKWPEIRLDPIDPEKASRRIGHLCRDAKPLANNVAILCGEASGIVVMDIDVVDNGVGMWEEAVKANGGIPDTFTVLTGSGGLHIYFKYDSKTAELTNSNRIFGYPWDFRSSGGIVVAPGSILKETGREYKVLSGYPLRPSDNPEEPPTPYPLIAEMPDWIFQMLLANQQQRHG